MLGKKICGMVMLSVALASGKIVDDKTLGTKTPVVSTQNISKGQTSAMTSNNRDNSPSSKTPQGLQGVSLPTNIKSAGVSTTSSQ